MDRRKYTFRIILFTVVGCVTFAALYAISRVFPLATALTFPEEVSAITISNSDNEHLTSYTDAASIELFKSYIVESKPTRKHSLNDFPVNSEYFSLQFALGDEENAAYTKIYIYSENNDSYLELPYYGIYEVDAKILDLIP